MKINIKDIPAAGLVLDFDLSIDELNTRVNSVRESSDGKTLLPPEYLFTTKPKVSLTIAIQGSMVTLKGTTVTTVQSTCARCAEDVTVPVEASIDYVVKPRPGSGEIEEDLHYSYYDGEEVNCAVLAEENLVLALPFSVFCAEEDAEKCSQAQLSIRGQIKDPEPEGDERFAILKTLKIPEAR